MPEEGHREKTGAPKPIQKYETFDIVVTFDPNICRHGGDCVRGLPAVFDLSRRRWIRPELATAAEVEAQVRRCPSGALQCRSKDDATFSPPRSPESP